MPKLIKVQRLRYGYPILRFDDNIQLKEVSAFVANVFQEYLEKYEKFDGIIKARNATTSEKAYGIFLEGCNSKNPLLEIAPTESGSVFVIKGIRAAVSENHQTIMDKDVFVSYLENSREKELSGIGQ